MKRAWVLIGMFCFALLTGCPNGDGGGDNGVVKKLIDAATGALRDAADRENVEADAEPQITYDFTDCCIFESNTYCPLGYVPYNLPCTCSDGFYTYHGSTC